jgi:uncharacterized protein YhaN
MKISRIDIGAFGVWSGLRLGRLSRGVNVIAGLNDGGKSTLREFWLSMLLGFGPERLRSVAAAKPGTAPRGQIELEVGRSAYELTRRGDEVALVHKADGQRLAGQEAAERLAQWIAGLEESDLTSVYVPRSEDRPGFGSLQQSRLWSSVFAAEMESLPSGNEVIEKLQTERRALLASGKPLGPLADALQMQRRLDAEITKVQEEQAAALKMKAGDQKQIELFEKAERRVKDLEAEGKLLVTAAKAHPVWQQLGPLRRKAGANEDRPPLPDGAVRQWQELSRATKDCREELELAEAEVEQLREAADEEKPDGTFARLAPRIEGLAQQLGFVRTLRTRHDGITKEIAKLDAQLRELPKAQAAAAAKAPPSNWKSLARTVTKTKKASHTASEAVRKASAELAKLKPEKPTAQPERVAPRDNVNWEERVGLLRRASNLHQQFTRLEMQYEEQADRCREHVGVQLIPTSVLMLLGVFLTAGTILLVASLLRPDLMPDWIGWPPAVTGLVGLLMASGARYLWEQTSEERLAQAKAQLEIVQQQLDHAYDELKKVETQLPRDDRPIAERLAEAQIRFEQSGPAPVAKKSTSKKDTVDELRRQVASLKETATQARKRYDEARSKWEQMLRAAGLPLDSKPSDLEAIAVPQTPSMDAEISLRQRLDLRNQEAASVATGIEHFKSQLEAVLMELNRPMQGDIEKLVNGLVSELTANRDQAQKRKSAVTKAKQAAKLRDDLRKALRKAEQTQERFLKRCHCDTEEELLRVANGQTAQADVAAKRPKLEDAFAKLIEGVEEKDLMEWLTRRADEIEARRFQVNHDLEVARHDLNNRRQHTQGREAAIKKLAGDEKLPRLLWQRSQLQARIRQLQGEWITLATAQRALEGVLGQELDEGPQPELLVWASNYFRRITGGRFRRIGTRWADRSLRLIDTSGASHGIEQLTDPTRQQLFLSLRLALVKAQQERGFWMPLVFDELLADYDDRRAQATAELLNEFASQGHQIILLTCHERTVDIFRTLGASLLRLPPWGEARPTLAVEPVAEAKPRVEPRPIEAPIEPPAVHTCELPPPVVEIPKVETPPPPPRAPEPEPVYQRQPEPQPEPVEPSVLRMPTLDPPPPVKPRPKVEYVDENGDPIGPVMPARPKRSGPPLGLRRVRKSHAVPKPRQQPQPNGYHEPWPWPMNGRAYR